MKSLKPILYFLTIIILNQSCQRDDICTEDTPTTPRLLVEFFDIIEQDVLKSVPRLSVYAAENSPEDPNTNFVINNSNTNVIALPLIVGNEGELTTTRFALEMDTNLRLDEDPDTNSNVDIIEITYTPEFQFVSRACGFRSVFTNVSVSVVDDGNNWILLTNFPNIINNTITVEDETATHLNILH